MITLFWVIGIAFFAVPVILMAFVVFLIMTDQTTIEEQMEAAEWLTDVDESAKN